MTEKENTHINYCYLLEEIFSYRVNPLVLPFLFNTSVGLSKGIP